MLIKGGFLSLKIFILEHKSESVMSDNKTVRNISSSKQAGGGGFVYEDKVAGYMLAYFLAARNIFGDRVGDIISVSFQVRQDGWLFDDMLVTLDNGARIGISVKSNKQVGPEGPYKIVLQDLWNQYSNTDGLAFKRNTDYLCMVTAPLDNGVWSDLQVLLRQIKEQDEDNFIRRIESDDSGFSQSQKMLFKGFHCPENLNVSKSRTIRDTVFLLKRLFILQFDFENDISLDLEAIQKLCSNLLREGDGTTGELLFEHLCKIRSDMAPLSGDLNRKKLVQNVGRFFQLRGYPDHDSDWAKLKLAASQRLTAIQDKIGNTLVLNRSAEASELFKLVKANSCILIVGASGSGKSVLLRKMIEGNLTEWDQYIYLDAPILDSPNPKAYLGLSYSLPELIDQVQQESYLLIDGIDRLVTEAQLISLHHILTPCLKQDSLWKIIVTCQTDEYDEVLKRLYRINISLQSARYELISNLSLYQTQLYEAFPQFRELLKHDHLKNLLNNLKYLDLLAYNTTTESEISSLTSVGEASIIDWIWDMEIGTLGLGASRFLQSYSEMQAKEYSMGLAEAQFETAEISNADPLVKKKVLLQIRDRLYLSHDLFGDWARYKLIRGNENKAKEYLLSKDLASPLWAKAIRLFGIHLLESNDKGDNNKWNILFVSLHDNIPAEKIIQDMLLEAILYSSRVYEHLEDLWEPLSSKKGELLQRFLEIFLIRATYPDSSMMDIASKIEGITASEAATIRRIPNLRYWVDVVKFLHLHKDDVILYAPKKTGLITKMWLEYTPSVFPYRKEMAEVALTNARSATKGGYVRDDTYEIIYSAMLHGIKEFPDGVKQLSLLLAGKIKHEESSQGKGNKKVKRPSVGQIYKNTEPWPDGPVADADQAFEKVCINGDALHPVIDFDPIFAREIILSLIIAPPKKGGIFGDDFYDDESLSINSDRYFYPPIYSKGPFLYFIQKHPLKGTRLIIDLINFATQRWCDRLRKKGIEPYRLILDKNQKENYFAGNVHIYFWFRDIGNAPDVVVSALQALEKYLIDSIDSEKAIKEILETILQYGQSAALLGVVVSIGKYSPELFLNELKPLLPHMQLYIWERELMYGGRGIEGAQMMGFATQGTTIRELALQWHSLQHRKQSLQNVALHLYANFKELQSFYGPITAQWEADLQVIEEAEGVNVFLNNLISYFRIENYETIQQDGASYYQYKRPADLIKKYAPGLDETEKDNELLLFTFLRKNDLDEKKPYTLSECESLWKKTQEISAMEDDDPFNYINGKHQNVLAGYAVLIANMSTWKELHQEYLNTIIEYVFTLLKEYKPKKAYRRENDMMDMSWMVFLARVVGGLYGVDANDKNLRELVGIFVFKADYKGHRKLFETVSSFFEWTDAHFIALQNLAISYSLALSKEDEAETMRHFESFEGPTAKTGKLAQLFSWLGVKQKKNTTNVDSSFNIETHEQKLLKFFIDNKFPKTLINWAKERLVIQTYEDRTYLGNTMTPTGFKPGIDNEMLQSIFSSLPELNMVSSDKRQYYIHVWKQLLEQLLFQVGPVTNISTRRERQPDGYSRWLIMRIAQLLNHLKEHEAIEARNLWEPILVNGNTLAEYIYDFMLHFYLSAMEYPEKHDRFFSIWHEMNEIAKDNELWRAEKFVRHQSWHSLMGITDQFFSWWKLESCEAFFIRLVPYTMAWCAKHSGDQEIIAKVLIILRTHPSAKMISEGLTLVNRHLEIRIAADKVPVPEGYVRRDFEHENELARTISFLWEKESDLIKSGDLMFANFKKIVIYLVARQNPIGLELQDRIIGQ